MSYRRVQCGKPVIGLVGGIGAGKTSVARLLASLGAVVIDSDRLAHDELQSAEVAAALVSWWGPSILGADRRVDRRAVASVVFRDAVQLKRLEDLLYPRIERCRREIMERVGAAPEVRAFVLDAPKLVEAGLADECDAVIFVEADWPVRVRRVAASRGWSEEELRRRENLQFPLDKKRAIADYVVTNNHSECDALRPEVERVFSSVLKSCS